MKHLLQISLHGLAHRLGHFFLCRGIGRYRTGHPLAKQKQTLEPDNVKAFLFKCIQNGCLDYLKHRAVMEDYEQEMLVAEERLNWLLAQTDRNEIWSDLVVKDLSANVDKVLEKLPQRCREAFRLSFYEDLTYKEIAERMNISPRTVEEHVQKAIRVLRVELKDILIL